ncbi:MAG: divergent polysaccharide deacetylase family protein [Rhodospirillum sp.]|nr:divergent polysaccharide deacetylase family protein [Rhodospirillum sp.]
MVKLPSLPKFGKKNRPDDEDDDDFELELDGFHEDDDDGIPLFGHRNGREGSGGDDTAPFIDDLADGDVDDDLGTPGRRANFDLDPLSGFDRSAEDDGEGFLAKLKGLFKGRSEAFEDDDPHFRDSDDDGEGRGRTLLHILAVLVLGGALIGGYIAVTSGPDKGTAEDTYAATTFHPLPEAGSDPRNGLMTPPLQGGAEGQDLAETDRSPQRRPWLSDNASESPSPDGAPDTAAAVADPTKPAPVDPTPEAQTQTTPETGPKAGTDSQAAISPSTAPTPGTGPETGAKREDEMRGEGRAFQRPPAELLPQPVAAVPEAPPFPVEEGFRPGRIPRYSDLPAPGSQGGTPLSDAPLTDLMRASDSGLLPVIAEDGRMPWRTYARPFTGDPTLPRVAIIIDGLGLRDDATQAAIAQTPPDVTLSFSPYAENLAIWMGRAREAGHETLLDLPVEPLGFPSMDPGPLALLSIIAELENRKRLDAVLGRAGGYVGLIATAAGRFTETPASMRPLLQSLKTRGLLYVQRGDVVGVNANNDLAPPVNRVTVDLDQDPFQRAIDARLTYLEEEARTQGFAIGATGATPVALYRLTRWLETLGTKGLALAPVSAVMLTKERDPRQ